MPEEKEKQKVAIFLYDGVEILDFSGPAEVFAVSGYRDIHGNYQRAFEVFTVAVGKDPIISQGFLKVMPDYTIEDAPSADIIVLPGGATGKSRKTPEVIRWIRESAGDGALLMSVFTGAFLLGDAGLLDNKSATTWYGALERLEGAFPKTEVLKGTRFVDDGQVVTTAGVSAGIDGALHLVNRLISPKSARATAEYMEYDKWIPEDGKVMNP
ncbi:DJ-1/PfpI family protein [Poritiphilus flavus]|uniref:DJ-1/PfpI family protein n=1 Tax=Poritiphilus flavus TaxID=2697053 RepID=A0A6L9E7J3_9FLAO|nr:DJ-1/PfpI family protein [Poritiphilus flavus]NAS10697.1 DJ-1/PfpI family protein [Poritiphilus flavus]